MEKIIQKNLTEQFRSDYQRYGIYVTYNRIMCDIRDGLTPVQRRIIYTMNEIGATQHTVKSATITGAVMKYHPHSDCYGSMKSMTNYFESYLPLLHPQGNFGTPYGDPASANRYTESKLNQFSLRYVVGDLREAPECVDWGPNYDNTTVEPEFLPTAVPLALINGGFGIGLGKKVEMASHNINDVIDATLALIKNPNANICLIPDTCMECDIYDEGQWQDISNNGFGYYTVRGHATTELYNSEEFKNRPAVVITSVPNMIYVDQIKEQIEALVAKKKLIQIEKMNDESGIDNLRFVIVLKPGADANYVLNMLYQNTSLQTRVRINFEMLNGLNIVRPSYKEYLLFFIQHRKQTKYRLYVNRLRQMETRMHELEAFIKLLKSGKIDEVIPKIRKYKGKDDDMLVEYLIKLLSVTDLQAKYIISSRLSSLTAASLQKLEEQYAKLEEMKQWYMEVIMDDNKLVQSIVDELVLIKAKFGCPRRSRLIKTPSAKDTIPGGSMLVGITQKGFVKKIPLQNNAQFGPSKNDPMKLITVIDNADDLIVFDSSGKVFRCPVHKIPFTQRNESGTDFRFIQKSFNGDAIQIIALDIINSAKQKSKKKARSYIITLSKAGLIKKLELEEFSNITSAGLQYAKLDQGDIIQAVCIANSYQSIMPYGNRKMMRIPVESIPTMKRAAKGNRTIKNGVDGMIVLDDMSIGQDFIITLTKQGRINKIALSSVPAINTPKKEFSIIRLSKTDAIQNVMLATNEDTLLVRCVDMPEIMKFPVSAIPNGSTISGGDKVITPKTPIIESSITNHPQ